MCQHFGKSFYEALKEAKDVFRKYKKLVFLYPSFTNHRKETLTYFIKYCEEFGFEHEIEKDLKIFTVEKKTIYISLNNSVLGVFLEQCKAKNIEPGVDVGFLSYNETPMKKFIYKGISVVSTDFKVLGIKDAAFVNENKKIQCYMPTKLILKESL